MLGAKETLSTNKIQELFGNNRTDIIVYDYDTDSYNTTKYHGYKLSPDAERRRKISYKTFQSRINSAPEFAGKYEIVGFAAMAVNYPNYPHDDKNNTVWRTANIFVDNPQHDRYGLQVVGTIIVRDKRSGKILPVPNKWMLLLDGRTIVRGKSYVDGAQKNLDSIKANHNDAKSAKDAKIVEKFARKLQTAQRIANCENRRELASSIYWQMPMYGTSPICPAFYQNAIKLYTEKQR